MKIHIQNHTFDSWMPLNICDSFLFAILEISEGLVLLQKQMHSTHSIQLQADVVR